MEQLNGLDSMFLYLEQPGLPMTISTVSIYDPSRAPQGPVRFKDILKTFENGIPKASVFRRRLVTVPGNLDHPYWIEDPDFDLEFHVRHIALPKPGDWRQLYIQLARLQARPIDRSRPLWEAYVIEGLNQLDGVPPGSFALMLKVHHAAMDGKTGINLFLAMHEFDPVAPASEGEILVPREPMPSAASLLYNTAKNYTARSLGAVGIARDYGRRLWRVQRAKREGLIHDIEGKTHVRFNDAPSANRSVARYRISREQCQQVRRLISGATINDVMLAVISGAQREYLASKGELPEHTLVAGCPVDVRNRNNRDQEHNLVGIMNVALCTDIADPFKRFRTVHKEALAAKAYHQSLGPDLVNSTTQLIPPYLLGWGVKGFLRVADRMPGVQNVLISNVPGIEVPVYFAGARMIDAFGLGPVLPHCNLFHTVSSMLDHLSISINACRQALPDPEFYIECLDRSWQSLYDCVDSSARRVRSFKPAAEKARGAA